MFGGKESGSAVGRFVAPGSCLGKIRLHPGILGHTFGSARNQLVATLCGELDAVSTFKKEPAGVVRSHPADRGSNCSSGCDDTNPRTTYREERYLGHDYSLITPINSLNWTLARA
jgi:hypothetical protein